MTKSAAIAQVLIHLFTFGFLLRGKIMFVKFDPKLWKNIDLRNEEHWSLRWEMMNSLKNDHKLVGKSYLEIEEMLGKPDGSFDDTIAYDLGYTGAGMSTGTLYISFGNSGLATKFNVSEA